MTDIRLAAISRYPVKGLDPQRLDIAELTPGQVLPGDRRFALAHGASAYDAATPAWAKKAHFLNWARHPALARLRSRFDASGSRVTLSEDGNDLVQDADLTSAAGRAAIAALLVARLPQETRGSLVVAEAPGISFSDVDLPFISLQSSASLADISARADRAIDVRRMRGNLVFDGAPAWAEMDWIGQRIAIGGAVLEVVESIGRCPATMINPESGERDFDTPALLQAQYGHQDCGIYAKVVSAGSIRPGDAIRLL